MLQLANGNQEQGLRHVADEPITPDQAKSILGDFLRGGLLWREQWTAAGARATDRALTGAETFSMSTMTWAGGFIGVGIGQLYFLQSGSLLVACLAIALLILIGVKALREVQVRRWPTAAGVITKSDLQARVRKFRYERARLDNIPAVEYRFTVAGRHYVGTRIGLNTEYAGVDVGALVAKYPVGAVVQVAYNPKNPIDCLLDPYANKGILLDGAKFAAMIGGAGLVLYYGPQFVTHQIAQCFPDADAPHAVLAFGIGLFLLLLFVWNLVRQVSARTDASETAGKVVVSEVETISLGSNRDSGGRFSQLVYQPTIEVAYKVSGLRYAIRRAIPDETLDQNTFEAAKAQLLSWPVGREVTVSYDPENPASASIAGNKPMPLESRFHILTLLIAIGCFALGARALGLF
ncbi:MAG TPA: DUF3592 domain-containing protein [Rhodoblastus sp.]|nr:DUF3592 domain-containing protein [Rhodoblastus sp.]